MIMLIFMNIILVMYFNKWYIVYFLKKFYQKIYFKLLQFYKKMKIILPMD